VAAGGEAVRAGGELGKVGDAVVRGQLQAGWWAGHGVGRHRRDQKETGDAVRGHREDARAATIKGDVPELVLFPQRGLDHDGLKEI